ncbi:MAG: DNA cytosine methyltransferase [Methanobacteriota archaeon]|nr:MAG: DNA cytosine methyltransferase [Euryarchaeota archaeon]
MLKFVDLFSGGGGSSAGYHMAGLKTAFAIDSEYHCVQTYRANFGDVIVHGDVSKLHSYAILDRIGNERPFLVNASPPCEPYTTANSKRVKDPYMRMFDDPTGRLMIHAIRLIGDLEPEYYVIENVMGILEGENADLIADEFERLGYNRPYFNVIEAHEWGVPSRRTRVFISNVKLKSPRLPLQTVRDAIGDLPPPQYPNDYSWHEFIPVPSKHTHKVVGLTEGQGLVFFRGAKRDHKNFIRLSFDKVGEVVMGKSRFVHPTEDRLLTPREHARLMTFPDSHKLVGSLEEVYDIVGEAVPSQVAFQIARQLLEHYGIKQEEIEANMSFSGK